MVYQPHRFTRTRDHFDDFVSVLSEGGLLILLDVYAAGEAPIDGADSHAGECDSCSWRDRPRCGVCSDPTAPVLGVLADNDVLLMQGAGDIGRLAATLAVLSHWMRCNERQYL